MNVIFYVLVGFILFSECSGLSKQCTSICAAGVCDQFMGVLCKCYSGYSGANCSTPSKGIPSKGIPSKGIPSKALKCVQCDGETDANCQTSASGTKCSSWEKYCTMSKTVTILPTDGKAVSTVVKRYCSSEPSRDCSSSSYTLSPPLYYVQFTCSESCQTNNCNVGLPPSKGSFCLVCNGVDCQTSSSSIPVRCPNGENICFSTVEYVIDPDGISNYALLSVKRGCTAAETLPNSCTSQAIKGVTLNKVKCHENCKSNGCNTGWPTRPKCVQRFGRSTACGGPHEAYCFSGTTKLSGSGQSSVDIERGCTAKKVNYHCNITTNAGVTEELCYGTCSTTGCNRGFKPGAKLQVLITCLFISMLISSQPKGINQRQ